MYSMPLITKKKKERKEEKEKNMVYFFTLFICIGTYMYTTYRYTCRYIY